MSSTRFSKENQPAVKRTKNKLTLVLEAIQSEKLLNTNSKSSKEDVEKAVFAYLAKTAFMPTEENAPMASHCLQLLIKKAWPDSKPSNDPVNFKYDRNATASDKAESVLEAVASGDIPPDIGATLIGMIKDGIAIKESTELVLRLEEIEKKLSGSK